MQASIQISASAAVFASVRGSPVAAASTTQSQHMPSMCSNLPVLRLQASTEGCISFEVQQTACCAVYGPSIMRDGRRQTGAAALGSDPSVSVPPCVSDYFGLQSSWVKIACLTHMQGCVAIFCMPPCMWARRAICTHVLLVSPHSSVTSLCYFLAGYGCRSSCFSS